MRILIPRICACLCLLLFPGCSSGIVTTVDSGPYAQRPEVKWEVWSPATGELLTLIGDNHIYLPTGSYTMIVTASTPSGPRTLSLSPDVRLGCQPSGGAAGNPDLLREDVSQAPEIANLVLENLSLDTNVFLNRSCPRGSRVVGGIVYTATATNFAGGTRVRTLRIDVR
jgi:hypothetical protein